MSTLVEALGEGEELVRAVGREAVDADRERRTEQIAAIDGGLLRREIFFARSG